MKPSRPAATPMKTRKARLSAVVLALTGAGGVASPHIAGDKLRPPTVSDGIEMSDLGSPSIAEGESPCRAQLGSDATIASFAPDGKEFAVVLRRGDLRNNLIEYRMLLWNADHSRAEQPRVVLHMSSSSIRSAIDPDTISWTADGRSLTFLGEQPYGHHELFELNVQTGRLSVLVSYPGGNIINYSRDSRGMAMAYEEAALPLSSSLWNADTARHGLVVTSQSLQDVESGVASAHAWPDAKLIVANASGTREISPPKGSAFPYSYDQSISDRIISLSPNGRYITAIAAVPISQIPHVWRKYRDPAIRSTFEQSLNQGDLERYLLVDTRTGRSRVLLNTPVTWMWADRPVWAPDSRSVLLSDVLLPFHLSGATRGERDSSKRGTLEVDVGTGAVTPIDRRCDVALSWRGNVLTCAAEPSAIEMDMALLSSKKLLTNGGTIDSCSPAKEIQYQRINGKWRAEGDLQAPRISVVVRDGLNFPPKLYYEQGKKERLLLDLNPQFRLLRLAKETLVTWEWVKGHTITGGLYTPPDYIPGKRYPLVIQTHVFTRGKFNFFGGFSTANAAQPLAGHGIFVLQINDTDLGLFGRSSAKHWQLEEVQRAMRIYKSAITYLDKSGLIDPSRVGIIGFSHTCFFVDWAITHEPHLFAAASVSEGADGSYLEYMTDAVGSIDDASLYDGPPFDGNWKSWLALSPIFNIDHVRTPLWIGIDHSSLAYTEWEWLGGLKHLNKPVYMMVLDGRSDDGHLLVKPWDRLISSGGNLDWFDFWLNGRQNSNPAEAAQYARWRDLRVQYRRQMRPRPISWRSVE